MQIWALGVVDDVMPIKLGSVGELKISPMYNPQQCSVDRLVWSLGKGNYI